MTEYRQALLDQLSFRFGRNGPRAARTTMLDNVALPKRTLNDQAELKVWLAEVEAILAAKLAQWPVAL